MRRITDHVPVSNLITGRFKTGTDYTNWRPRGTRDWLLIATTRGSGLYEASDRRSFRSEACILTLYAPGVVQDYRTDTNARRWDLVWAHFVPRPHWTPLLAWPEVLPGLMALDMRSARASTDWLALVRELSAMDAVRHGGGSRSVDWSMNFLERALLIASRHVPDLSRSRQDRRIESVISHISQHLAEPMGVAKLASLTLLSPSRFAHLFREVTGLTPQRFIERRRLERSVELLESTQLTVKEIAHAVGFKSQFYLSLRFKRAFGVAPTHFRQERS